MATEMNHRRGLKALCVAIGVMFAIGGVMGTGWLMTSRFGWPGLFLFFCLLVMALLAFVYVMWAQEGDYGD